MDDTLVDVAVIGAGPTGLACAIELTREGYRYVVLEKGCVVNSLFHFPTNMVYFTTPELLEIGDLPLVCQGEKPTRLEALKYYRKVAETYALEVHQYEAVTAVTRGADGIFEIVTRMENTREAHRYRSRALIVATGYYDNPNRLGIPGEDLPKVSHYYTESHPFHRREVMVIGAANSAAEAALDLFRGGAKVTLVHRRSEPSSGLKYWVAPDLANRIKASEIRALFDTEVTEIRPASVSVRLKTGETLQVPNDYVFALTGYHADTDFLRAMGVRIDPETQKPALDPETLESNVPGLYMAGVVIAGVDNNKVFIENGRLHGKQVVRALRARLAPTGRPVPPPPARRS